MTKLYGSRRATFHDVLESVTDASRALAVLHVDVRLVLFREERIVRDDVAVVEHDLDISALLDAYISVVVRIRGIDESRRYWRPSPWSSTGRGQLAGSIVAVVGLVV